MREVDDVMRLLCGESGEGESCRGRGHSKYWNLGNPPGLDGRSLGQVKRTSSNIKLWTLLQ